MSMPEHDRFADDAHRYALISRIATGGMGEVWRGEDTTLGRAVAVKLLKAEYADDATFRRRFESEAQHAASLHHPGIAGVFDFGEAVSISGSPDGGGTPRPYLVMELVEGQPLSALLRPGAPLDAEVTRDLMAQAAEALGAAHAAGIVHRDVKPGNLIVTPDRRIKVTDFGIARAADGLAITETGQVMGTPAYLSPEQAEGGRATAASDVYSLGCVAFECLAGRRAFTADTAVATAVAHLRQPVPTLPSSVPAALAAVVTRALAKDPAARYADGSAFAAALRSPSSAAAAPLPVPLPAVDPAPETQVLPATTATPVQTSVPAPAQRRTNVVPWFLLGAVLVASALIIWQIVSNAGEAENQPTDRQSPSQTRSQTESPATETTEPTVAGVEVDEDDYLGREIGEVQSALKDLGLKVSREKLDNPGDQVEGAVAGVNPSGTLVEGDSVTVSYWGKAPKVTETPTETPTGTPTETPTQTPTETPTEPTTETTSPTESATQ